MSDKVKDNLVITLIVLFIGSVLLWRLEVGYRKEIEVSRDYWINSNTQWRETALWWIRRCK